MRVWLRDMIFWMASFTVEMELKFEESGVQHGFRKIARDARDCSPPYISSDAPGRNDRIVRVM